MVEIPTTPQKRVPRSRWDVFEKSMRGMTMEEEGQKGRKNGNVRRHSTAKHKDIPIPSPSASILLISPQNRILLLHRVNTSTSFASAHVFPGGHLSPQDGNIPPNSDPLCHQDSTAYRRAAIRECFEESGILLARPKIPYTLNSSETPLVELEQTQRDEGRKAVHAETIKFADWLEKQNVQADIEGLIPFTRWLTPANIPKRFSTQMYLYFLPLESSLGTISTQMHVPTPDGGIEHTAAQFRYAQEWIDLSLRREIILFPPQFFLLSLVSEFLTPPIPLHNTTATAITPPSNNSQGQTPNPTQAALQEQRDRLITFVQQDGDPPWSEKCISPDPYKREDRGRYLIMGLSHPGPELEGTGRKGETERVLRVELDKEMERGRRRPHPKEVIWIREVLKNPPNGAAKL